MFLLKVEELKLPPDRQLGAVDPSHWPDIFIDLPHTPTFDLL